MMNRRHFIKKSAALLAAGSIAGQEMYASDLAKRNKGRIGLQLWSVRPDLSKDFVGTLKKISEIGYSAIETFFKEDKFFGHTMKEINVITKDLGMSVSGTAYQISDFLPENFNAPEWDNWKRCAEDMHTVGAKWAVQASLPGYYVKNMDELKRAETYFHLAGEFCKQNGLKFGFHTHEQDFDTVDGVRILDYLIQKTNPKQVFFQLEMINALLVGIDPLQYMLKYPKRFPLWHASDYDLENKKIVGVGNGSTNYPALFDKAKAIGLEQLTVELHFGDDRLALCKSAFDYFKQFKWTKV